jgi:hypothetical protein
MFSICSIRPKDIITIMGVETIGEAFTLALGNAKNETSI